MLNIAYYRNTNQNYNEVSPHTYQNDQQKKIYKQQMLERMWRKGNPLALLVEMSIGTATMRTAWRFLKKKLGIKLPYDPAIPLLGIYLEKTTNEKDTCTPVLTVKLFSIVRT